MKAFVVKDTLFEFVSGKQIGGWGNGYVVVNRSSPLFGKDRMDDIFDEIRVNGGLTYSDEENDVIGFGGDGWVFGFDTKHYWDTKEMWPDGESVLREAERLLEQLEKLERRRRMELCG